MKEEFLNLMTKLLGSDYDDFVKSYNDAPKRGIRSRIDNDIKKEKFSMKVILR